jgi:hypothetical protein
VAIIVGVRQERQRALPSSLRATVVGTGGGRRGIEIDEAPKRGRGR